MFLQPYVNVDMFSTETYKDLIILLEMLILCCSCFITKMLRVETLMFKNRIQCDCRFLPKTIQRYPRKSEECKTPAIIILKYASLEIERIAVNNTLL